MANQLDKPAPQSEKSVPVVVVTKLIRGYQLMVSPFLGRNCRFYPSCSEYGKEALLAHGVIRGLWLLAWRLMRCHPWSDGGYDPVPARKPG